jgi:hypothetical protein
MQPYLIQLFPLGMDKAAPPGFGAHLLRPLAECAWRQWRCSSHRSALVVGDGVSPNVARRAEVRSLLAELSQPRRALLSILRGRASCLTRAGRAGPCVEMPVQRHSPAALDRST